MTMTGIDQLLNWELSYWVDPFLSLLGPVFPAAVSIGLMAMAYVYSGSMAMPTVLAILLGGGIITWLPAEAHNAGFLLIFLGVASALYVAFKGDGRGRL